MVPTTFDNCWKQLYVFLIKLGLTMGLSRIEKTLYGIQAIAVYDFVNRSDQSNNMFRQNSIEFLRHLVEAISSQKMPNISGKFLIAAQSTSVLTLTASFLVFVFLRLTWKQLRSVVSYIN